MSRCISSTSARHVLSYHPANGTARITLLPRRHQHSMSAAEAAKSMLARFKGIQRVEEQVLDGNQLQKLSLTLGRRALYPDKDISQRAPYNFTVVPQGYHLVYFTPNGVEEEVGPDGTDVSYNAPAPFTRRMWAGGRMRWETRDPGTKWENAWLRDGKGIDESNGDTVRDELDVKLVVGDQVRESTTLLSATPKVGRDGSEMLLVEVRKEFETGRGLALVDERSWIFRPETTVASPATTKTLGESVIRGPSTVKDIPRDKGYPKRELRWSPTGLFRFSALTFNGHKIHYDPTWSAAVEGHPACVVHGPINLISMLDYWRDHCAAPEHPTIKEISYRALAPIYAGETYDISAEKVGDDTWEVLVRKQGIVCMRGEILAAGGREEQPQPHLEGKPDGETEKKKKKKGKTI